MTLRYLPTVPHISYKHRKDWRNSWYYFELPVPSFATFFVKEMNLIYMILTVRGRSGRTLRLLQVVLSLTSLKISLCGSRTRGTQ